MIASLAYLKKVLGFMIAEWQDLSEADRDTLRQWAREELEVLGVSGSVEGASSWIGLITPLVAWLIVQGVADGAFTPQAANEILGKVADSLIQNRKDKESNR